MYHFLIALFITFFTLNSQARIQIIDSGKNRIELIELYTSQGCSSCPPAEQWFSTLLNNNDLWHKIVPINFHVDYWDSLGWPDKYASPKFTQRQYIYKISGNTKTVATPGFVISGKGWTGWFSGHSLPLIPKDSLGQLTLEITNNHVSVKFMAHKKFDDPVILNISQLGFGLFDDIKQGENKGKLLRHDFVALTFEQQTLLRNNNDNEYVGIITLTKANLSTSLNGIAAWVTVGNSQTPVQAVGGFLE